MTFFASPFGKIYISADSEKVHSISWLDNIPAVSPRDSSLEQLVVDQLKAYFSEPDFVFDLPLASAPSDFSAKIRDYLKNIPSGQTRTYGEIAEALSSSARAVGMACRHNPFAIIIPCHRVVAKNSLGGYYGNTQDSLLAIKTHLLSLEKNFDLRKR